MTLISCTRTSASLLRQPSEKKVVLQRCSETTEPFPDAYSNHCITITLSEAQVLPGSVVPIHPGAGLASLFQKNGPSHDETQEVEGDIRIIDVAPRRVRAALHVRTSSRVKDEWQWKYDGEDRYTP